MSDIKNDYAAAKGFSEGIAAMGWIVIVISFGLIIWLIEMGSMALMAIPTAIIVALVGLLLVVAGQSLRAQLDAANYTKQMLEIMKKKF